MQGVMDFLRGCVVGALKSVRKPSVKRNEARLKNQARLEIIFGSRGLVLDHLFELLQRADFDSD